MKTHSSELLKRIRLPFQKLDTMLLNDIRLFLRDTKSLVLVVLTPFLILSILINIFYFSDVEDTIRGVQLGVCDRDGKGFDMESKIFKTTLFSGDCEALVADKVSSGELRGAVVIPENFRQDLIDGKGSEMKLFVDNSKQTTAVVVSNAVRAYVADVNEKMGTAFILEAWKNLNELNNNLRFLVGNLEKAKPVAIELQQRLDTLNADLSGIDFASQQAAVTDVINYLDILSLKLDSVNQSFASIPAIPAITIDTYDLGPAKAFCNDTLSILNPLCSAVSYVDSAFTNLTYYETSLNSQIALLNNQSAQFNDSITKLNDLLATGSASNTELRDRIALIRSNLVFLEEKTGNITQSIVELNASVNKFLSDIVRVTDELNKTIDVLDTYTKKNPSTILRPVRVDEKVIFKDKLEIFYRLPALMSILLLFVTLFISSSLIVNERRGGTMARIFLSPISMFFYVFEKLIYLLLLAVMIVGSMLIAALVFKVPMALSMDLILVFIVASLVYISIGLFIGAFSKSENTSLLTCLVIGFPLMFMSGAFSPPELMGEISRVISKYLPLTLNISLIEQITIYHTSIDLTQLLIMIGMILVLYIAAVLLIRNRPTLK